jgi:hypothetical protein
VALLTACSSTPFSSSAANNGPLSSGRVAHAITISNAIAATGIGCSDASLETNLLYSGTNPIKEQSSCTIGDDTVAISLFADHDALVGGHAELRQGSCYVAARQTTNLTYVEGDNWIVFPEQEETARRIAASIQGTLRTIHC